MIRSLYLLFFSIVVLLASPASALEIVLRDTIGPDSSATSDSNSSFANTNQGAGFSNPGVRVVNTSGKLGKLTEIKTVLVAKSLSGDEPINDLTIVEELRIEAHVWQDGLEGPGDSYDNNPAGFGGGAHVFQTVDYMTNASLELFSTGNADGYDTYLLTIDMSSQQILIEHGQEFVFSTMQGITGPTDQAILKNFSRIFYQVDGVFIEDVYQDEVTRQSIRPGYVNSQLGVNGFNYGAYASIEFLEADYINDGVVDGGDFLEW